MRALETEVVGAVWAAVEPLLPAPDRSHPLGCHRPRIRYWDTSDDGSLDAAADARESVDVRSRRINHRDPHVENPEPWRETHRNGTESMPRPHPES